MSQSLPALLLAGFFLSGSALNDLITFTGWLARKPDGLDSGTPGLHRFWSHQNRPKLVFAVVIHINLFYNTHEKKYMIQRA